MGLGLANTAQLAALLAEALDEITPKDGLPIWDSRLASGDLLAPSPFPDGRKLGRSRLIGVANPAPALTPAWHHGQTRLAGEMVGTLAGTVPYLQRHTVEYFLPTRITTLATNTTLATSTRHDTAAKASLNLATKTTHCDTVIQTKIASATGNSLTIAFAAGGSGAGALTKVGSAYTFTFATGTTTVANFETAIAASADLEVKTAGTAANLLLIAVDEFTATNLAGGTDTLTIRIPETAERVFESVRLVVSYRSEWAATNSVIGWRLGIQLGSAAKVDFDRQPTAQNTASRNIVDDVDYDVTEYFNANFSGTSQTCVGSIAGASTVAANINQIAMKLVITYAFDPNAATTRLRTIRIPLQSMAGSLTTSQQEFGADGVNPVATNQIPALDTWLVEQSKVYRNLTLELWGHDGNSTGTTAFTPFIQLDAAAEVARATISQTVQTFQIWHDAIDLTGLDTSVAHKVSARADLTNRVPFICGFVVATYEYDHAATVTANLATYEALVPLTNSMSNASGPSTSASVDAATNTNRFVGSFSIQEPGTPTLLQSGIFTALDSGSGGGAVTVGLKLPQQAALRVHTFVAANSGPSPAIVRIDGTGFAIARGDNWIVLDMNGSRSVRYAYAIVNYTAGVRGGDVDRGNQPINYACHSFDSFNTLGLAETTREAQGLRPPILGPAYKINSAFIDALLRNTSTSNADSFLVEQLQGEIDGGWSASSNNTNTSAAVMMNTRHVLAFTRAVNRDSLSSGRLDLMKPRRYVAQSNAIWAGFASWSWWITYHQHQFTVAASVVIDGVPAAAGKSVKIFAYAASAVLSDSRTAALDAAELITTVQTDASGAFSAVVPDNTRSYFASYDNDGRAGRSLLGTPV